MNEIIKTKEPVAWMNINEDAGFKQITVFQEPTSKKSIPLYTHPKEWQGLSDDEVTHIGMSCQSLHQVARAIDAKLREKNT